MNSAIADNQWVVELLPTAPKKDDIYHMITASKGEKFWTEWDRQKRVISGVKGSTVGAEFEYLPPSSFEEAIDRAALISSSEFLRVRVRNLITQEIIPGEVLCG